MGGPTSPRVWFLESEEECEKNPIYLQILELEEDVAKNGKSLGANCNEVFAYYLIKIAKVVLPKFYKVIAIMICQFREMSNEFGWVASSGCNRIKKEASDPEYCHSEGA